MKAGNSPGEAAGKAVVQADIDKHEADSAESKSRKAAAEASIVTVTPEHTLTAEEHGALISGLVTRLIEGGVAPADAYPRALQALMPGAPPPPPSATSGLEAHIVQSYFDNVLDENKRLRELASRPPPAPQPPPQPQDPVVQMREIVTMGENILRQVYGVTPEQIANMKTTPTGVDAIAQLGGSMEAQIRLQEFIDERKMKWAAFDRTQEEWKREQARKDREADSKRGVKESFSRGIEKVTGALGRTLEAAARSQHKEAVEDEAERTGVNPTCTECGGELATENAAAGWATCVGCGASCRVEEING